MERNRFSVSSRNSIVSNVVRVIEKLGTLKAYFDRSKSYLMLLLLFPIALNQVEEKFNFELTLISTFIVGIVLFLLGVLGGYIITKVGLIDSEYKEIASRNPIMMNILSNTNKLLEEDEHSN